MILNERAQVQPLCCRHLLLSPKFSSGCWTQPKGSFHIDLQCAMILSPRVSGGHPGSFPTAADQKLKLQIMQTILHVIIASKQVKCAPSDQYQRIPVEPEAWALAGHSSSGLILDSQIPVRPGVDANSYRVGDEPFK